MRRILAIVLLYAVHAVAGDVTGKWSGSFKVSGGDHSTPQIVILKRNGKRLTGSVGPDASEQYPIENGRVDGDHVRFELTSGEWGFSYELKETGPDEMKGNLDLRSVNSERSAVVTLGRVK